MNGPRLVIAGENEFMVSVIVPVFNREKYLAQALDSALAQTYTNFEIITVDDGSTDASFSILNDYQKRFPEKVRVLSQKNSGPSVARNNAIMAAQGKYIAFLDSDDLWAPEKIERQLTLFEKYNEIAFVYSGYCLIDENGMKLAERHPVSEFKGNIYDKLWSTESNISGGTIMVEKKRLIQTGLFDTALRGAENHDLRIRLSKLGNVYYCEDLLYFYRIHKNSLTANSENMYKYHTLLLEKHFGKNGLKNRKLWKSIRSRQLYLQGGDFLRNGQLCKSAIKLFQSILLNPQRPRAYINLLRCFMGPYINSWLISLKKHKYIC